MTGPEVKETFYGGGDGKQGPDWRCVRVAGGEKVLPTAEWCRTKLALGWREKGYPTHAGLVAASGSAAKGGGLNERDTSQPSNVLI